MIRFSNYISEGHISAIARLFLEAKQLPLFTDKEAPAAPDFRRKNHGTGHTYTNSAKVGPHKVSVVLNHHDRLNREGEYSVVFKVNDSYSRGAVDNPMHALAIGSHIANAVHHFVKQKKPGSLIWRAADDYDHVAAKKDKTYTTFAKHLVRHFGGSYGHNDDDVGHWHSMSR